MSEKHWEQMDRNLDLLVGMTALQLTAGKKQTESIELLSVVGFQPKEIAEILGTTPNTVRVGLSGLRKKKRRKKNAAEED